MVIRKPREHDPIGGCETPESVFFSRRKLLLASGAGAAAIAGFVWWRRTQGSDDEVVRAGRWSAESEARLSPFYPAASNEEFAYGRNETAPADAARYTNFYWFSRLKWCWKYVGQFQPDPWSLVVDGLCRSPLTLDLDDLYRRFASDLQERQYRHRCV